MMQRHLKQMINIKAKINARKQFLYPMKQRKKN